MLDQFTEDYLLKIMGAEDPVLKELYRETHLKVLRPRMLSGHFQGKILEMISKMIAPEKILEIGTYTGYSAICLAKGLKHNGKLITIEINDELEKISQKYFSKAGLSELIDPITGNSLQVIPGLKESFDLVFIDGDKREYPEYYKTVFDKVRKGGYILADNILWNGKVIEPEQPDDEYTKGIMEFNQLVSADDRIEKVVFPLRDGLMLIRKK